MISEKQRRFYLVFVSIFILLGMLLYGLLAAYAQFPNVFLYTLLGGIFLGGIASGSILFGRYIRRKKSVALITLSCVLFPVTMMIIIMIGLYFLVPHYINNMIILVQKKKCSDPKQTNEVCSRLIRKTNLVYGFTLIVLVLGYLIYGAVTKTNITHDIYQNTGYSSGTPEYFIYRNYYYDGVSKDYIKSTDYNYIIKNDTLFILANHNGISYSNILFAQPNGEYPLETRDLYSGEYDGDLMREDIDKLFTNIRIAIHGDKYAFMLIIDKRNEQERIAQIKKQYKVNEERANLFLDRTYAEIEKLQLYDEKGILLDSISINNGEYIAFFDSFNNNRTDYKVIVTYEDNEYDLLTYNDIVHRKITAMD